MVANWWPKNVLANCFVWGLIWGSRIVQQLESRRDKQLKPYVPMSSPEKIIISISSYIFNTFRCSPPPTWNSTHPSWKKTLQAASIVNETSHHMSFWTSMKIQVELHVWFTLISYLYVYRRVWSYTCPSDLIAKLFFFHHYCHYHCLSICNHFFKTFFNQEDDDQNFGLQKQHMILFISCCTCCISPTGFFFSSPNWFFGKFDRIWIWKSQVLDVESLSKKIQRYKLQRLRIHFAPLKGQIHTPWNEHIPWKDTAEDDFPFPKVGYVSSLEGISIQKIYGGNGANPAAFMIVLFSLRALGWAILGLVRRKFAQIF